MHLMLGIPQHCYCGSGIGICIFLVCLVDVVLCQVKVRAMFVVLMYKRKFPPLALDRFMSKQGHNWYIYSYSG